MAFPAPQSTEAAHPPLELILTKKLGDLTEPEMREVLAGIASDNPQKKAEMETGIAFLNAILDERGVKGLIAFVEIASKKVDAEGRFLNYDFMRGNERLLRKAPVRLTSRRNFLETFGWGIAGAVGTVALGAETADEAYHIARAEPVRPVLEVPSAYQTPMKCVADWTKDYCVPPAELILSLALLHEGVRKWKEIKLEQVANAVTEMAKIKDPHHNPSPDLPTR